MRSSRLWSVVLLLSSAVFVPACSGEASEEGAESTESANTISELARRIRMARFQESLAPVMRGVIKDTSEVGVSVRAALADSERVIFNTQIPRDAPVNQVRKAVAALGKTKVTRRIMVENSLQALERRSSTLKELLSGRAIKQVAEEAAIELRPGKSMKYVGAMPDNVNVFDELVVGSGPQGVAYMQQITDAAPQKRSLAVDAASKPGGTFADVGEAFALNSTNRANTGTRAKPGEGDLNFIQDIWGLPDFEGQKWVPAGGLGDLATVGSDLASAEVMLGTKVSRVLDKLQTEGSDKWPARYLVEIVDQGDGTVNKVFTNKVVVASGIGTPTIPIKDAGTLRLIANERARLDLPSDEIPGIQTFTDVVNRIGQSDTPYRWAVGKDVVVAGGGDSAKVINEFLFRLAPEGAYGKDVAQVGNVKRVFWMGVSFEDCQQYIAQSRARYSRLSAALNSGELIPVPGKVTRIERSGSGYKLSYKTPDGEVVENAIKFAKPGVDGAAGQADIAEGALDHIILATGFRSEAEDVLKELLPLTPRSQTLTATELAEKAVAANDPRLAKLGEYLDAYEGDLDRALASTSRSERVQGELRALATRENPGARLTLKDALKDVNGRPDGFDTEVAIATRLTTAKDPSPHDIFFVGPSNELRGGLPKENELARVNANTVSLFANVQRTRQLAKMNAEAAALGLKTLPELAGVPKLAELYPKRIPSASPPVTFKRLDATAPLTTMTAIADIEIKVQVAKVLQRFEVPEGGNVKILVTKSGDELRLTIPDYGPASAEKLAKAIVRDNAKLGEMLFAMFGENGKAIRALEINVPTYGPSTSQVREVGIEVLRRM